LNDWTGRASQQGAFDGDYLPHGQPRQSHLLGRYTPCAMKRAIEQITDEQQRTQGIVALELGCADQEPDTVAGPAVGADAIKAEEAARLPS
jgi:hypothetical protein